MAVGVVVEPCSMMVATVVEVVAREWGISEGRVLLLRVEVALGHILVQATEETPLFREQQMATDLVEVVE